MNKFTYHKDGSQPSSDEIFVFGSNLSGIHGAGAAKQAMNVYGAKFGEAIGITGRCYAIPTKGLNISFMTLEEIKPYIEDFVNFTYYYPKLKFFVTRVGCGLAGFKDEEFAILFKSCNNNCNMPEQWKVYLEENT